jgi:hypothetical protein
MWTQDFKRIPSDAFCTSPALPVITSLDFAPFQLIPCSLALRIFPHPCPYHPCHIRTACEHFPTLPHHITSLATLSLSSAFFIRVSFCFAFVHSPHHHYVTGIRIISATGTPISGLPIIIIPLALSTSHSHMLSPMSLTGDSQ